MDIKLKSVANLSFPQWNFKPAQILVLGFSALILFGAILLSLPISSASGQPTPFINALFTATSATCVTGLIVCDTGTHWSLFGQMVIIGLIQAGGLGIMTMTTLMALIMRKKIRLRERLVMQQALNQVDLSGIVRITVYVAKATLFIEFIGGTILALSWFPEFGIKAIFYGYWHSVSSFCNAGFDLFGGFQSYTRYVTDWTVNLTVSTLIILGGIGFTVIADVWEKRKFRKLSLHSRVVITATLFLIIIGTLGIFAIEYNNPATLGALDMEGKILSSYFQSVSSRTAGCNTIDIGKMENAALFLIVILMFIGASPASTGGGVKTSTFSILLASFWAIIRNREDAVLFERRIPYHTVYKALAVVFLAAMLVIIVTMMISIHDNQSFLFILFEVVSAFGTVGLSTGITPDLSDASKLWLILTMLAGRVGPVTLVLAISMKENRHPVRYTEGRVIIG